MQVTIGNTITVKQPSSEILAWCKRNLIVANPEYAKKLRMHFWLGDTPADLYLYEIRGDEIVLPFGTLRSILPLLQDTEPRTTFLPAIPVPYRAEVPLYDYQERAVNAVLAEYYGILQSPAGSGKTQMGIAIIAKLQKKALWLTHTKDLLDQSRERAERYIDKGLLGTITEGKVNIGKWITFATVQTMCNLDLARYKHDWDVIIVDECHRVSGSPTALTQFYKVLNSLSARNKFGLSATVHRADGMIRATYAILGDVIYDIPESEVADKIMKVGIQVVGTPITLCDECLNTDGTINYTRLINYLCKSEERNEVIVGCMKENRGKPSLVLSDRLEHLEALMRMLPKDMARDSVMVSGKMTSKAGKAAREQAIEDMRTGRKKYLFATYTLAKEGLDIPCLERLYMATPQKDYAVIAQSIGRIARTHPGKGEPVCYDFVDDIHFLFKAHKKRCTTYRKKGCYFVGGNK